MSKLDESTLVQMGREYPDIGPASVAERMHELATLAKRHESLCVRACNEGDFDGESAIRRLENRIGHMLGEYFPNTAYITQRDPRGATIKLIPPSKATNDWGHEGLCVLA